MVGKQWARRLARAAGFDVVRTSRHPQEVPPELLRDPIAAVHIARGRVRTAFTCPLELARDRQGFSFGASGWHPLVATASALREAEAGSDDSTLTRYFDVFRPRTALEALPGFEALDPCVLDELPPHLFGLTPWYPSSIERLDDEVRHWTATDAEEHGLTTYDLDVHGVAYFGPASALVRDLEVHRLATLNAALRKHGYDRSHGDPRFYLVRRGREFRAVSSGGGRHRVAVMSAQGHRWVPATFDQPVAVDVRDVADWPQVRAGRWSERDALRYVDHLFDFDTHEWARQRQLT